MSARGRLVLLWFGAVGLATLLAWGCYRLPQFGNYPGPYGDLITARVPNERQVANAVTAINFDYRALDTLGEEFILFVAVSGVVLLLRSERGESTTAPPVVIDKRTTCPRSDAVEWITFGILGVLVLFGSYMVLHGPLTPGGGFQGGAIVGTASVLVYLGNSYRTYRRTLAKPFLETAEALGAASYALIGFAGIAAGGAFLQNVWPLGKRGDLFAGGTIPWINLSVGLAVAAGFALLFVEFLEETRAGEDEEKK